MHPPPAPPDRRRELVIPLLVLGIGACLAVLLVAVIGLTGGLAGAGGNEIPQVAPEEKAEGEPWNVTVIDAALFPGHALEPATRPLTGDHWLVVLAEIEVTADTPFHITPALQVSGVDGLVPDTFDPSRPQGPEVWRTRDSTQAFQLQPCLPERVLFLWERSGAEVPAEPPEEVQVEIMDRTFRVSGLSRYEHLYGTHSEWLPEEQPRAVVAVPLKDRRDDPAFQEEDE